MHSSSTLYLKNPSRCEIWSHSFWSNGTDLTPGPWFSAAAHAAVSTPAACKLASVKSWPGYDIFGPLAKFASPTSGRKNRTWAWTSMNIYHINLGLSCCFQIICRKYETLYIAFWFVAPLHCHFGDINPTTILSWVAYGAMADWRSWNMFQHAFSVHYRPNAFHSCDLQDFLLWNIASAKTHATGPRLYHSQWAKARLTLLNWHGTGQEANPKTKLVFQALFFRCHVSFRGYNSVAQNSIPQV